MHNRSVTEVHLQHSREFWLWQKAIVRDHYLQIPLLWDSPCTQPLQWWLRQWCEVLWGSQLHQYSSSCAAPVSRPSLLLRKHELPTTHFSDFIPPNASLSPGFSSMKCTIKQLHLNYGSNCPKTCAVPAQHCALSKCNLLDLQLVLQCHWKGWDSLEVFWNLGKLIQIMCNTLSWNSKSSHLTFWHVYYVYANSVFSAEFPWR